MKASFFTYQDGYIIVEFSQRNNMYLIGSSKEFEFENDKPWGLSYQLNEFFIESHCIQGVWDFVESLGAVYSHSK